MEISKSVTCTICPKGCRINVKVKDSEILRIDNYGCKRGLEYAKNEVTNPRRILTTIVKLSGGNVLPVRTKAPIPRKLLRRAMLELKDIIVTPPIKVGYVVRRNVAETGIDVISTGNATQAR